MTEYVEDYVRVKDIDLHYYRGGEGDKTIVLLHGATDNGMCWKPFADKLSEQYQVVMPDAQGHGLSDRLTEGFNFIDHAHQVAGLVAELGIEKPVLIGHSMGGSTATNVAGTYPDLPAGVILEDPGWMDMAAVQNRPPANTNDFARMHVEMSKLSIDQLIAQCRTEHPSWSEEELQPWAKAKKQFDINLFTYMQINRPSYSEMIQKIKCPALLITAESGIVTDEVARKAAETWTADTPLQVVKIMGAGHNIRRERFDEFYTAVTKFITNL